MLVQPSRGAGDREVDIEWPGSCLLVWKNCSTNGYFFAGVAPRVDISTMLLGKRSAEEELQAELEGNRQAAELLRRELEAEKQEQAHKRQEEREEKLTGLRAEVDESQVFLDATREGLSRHDAEIARLQEELEAVEQARSAEVAMASVTEQQLNAALDQIAALIAEQEQDEVELQGKDDAAVSCSHCGSVFTDDSVFCRTCAADRRDPGALLAELQPKLDELIEHEAAAGSATAPAALSPTAPTALSATAPAALSATALSSEPDFEQPAEAAETEIANNAEACSSLPTALEEASSMCILPGCTKPTFNGKPHEYCSRTHRQEGEGIASSAGAVVCATVGCQKPTWNGQPNEYCSQTHRREAETQNADWV